MSLITKYDDVTAKLPMSDELCEELDGCPATVADVFESLMAHHYGFAAIRGDRSEMDAVMASKWTLRLVRLQLMTKTIKA